MKPPLYILIEARTATGVFLYETSVNGGSTAWIGVLDIMELTTLDDPSRTPLLVTQTKVMGATGVFCCCNCAYGRYIGLRRSAFGVSPMGSCLQNFSSLSVQVVHAICRVNVL